MRSPSSSPSPTPTPTPTVLHNHKWVSSSSSLDIFLKKVEEDLSEPHQTNNSFHLSHFSSQKRRLISFFFAKVVIRIRFGLLLFRQHSLSLSFSLSHTRTRPLAHTRTLSHTHSFSFIKNNCGVISAVVVASQQINQSQKRTSEKGKKSTRRKCLRNFFNGKTTFVVSVVSFNWVFATVALLCLKNGKESVVMFRIVELNQSLVDQC